MRAPSFREMFKKMGPRKGRAEKRRFHLQDRRGLKTREGVPHLPSGASKKRREKEGYRTRRKKGVADIAKEIRRYERKVKGQSSSENCGPASSGRRSSTCREEMRVRRAG